MPEQQEQATLEEEKVGVGAYVFSFCGLFLFRSFYKMPEAYRWLGAFDFTTLIGKFGSISRSFLLCRQRRRECSCRFPFSLSLVPGVMLALGLLEVLFLLRSL